VVRRLSVVAGAAVLCAVAGCGSARLPTEPRGRPLPAADPAIPPALLRQARPIGRGDAFHPGAPARVAGTCRDALRPRIAVHLELFAANRVVIVPEGIGAARPWQTSAGRITRARCYGRFVTTDPTGVVLVAPGGDPTLGDLFRAWHRPLTGRRLLSFGGGVRVYIDGRRRLEAPARVPLRGHSEIVLEVGPYVPPHPRYTFASGT
jgi:hypothetical protein